MGIIRKRSVVLHGLKTSVSVEDQFWNELKEIAGECDITMVELISDISDACPPTNLSSAVRLYVLDYCLKSKERQRSDLL